MTFPIGINIEKMIDLGPLFGFTDRLVSFVSASLSSDSIEVVFC